MPNDTQIPAGQVNIPPAQSPPSADWAREVVMPLAKLAGVTLIAIALIYVLDLNSILSKAIDERTVIALAIILTFCLSIFMNLKDETMRIVKDAALVVLGFYFGSATLKDKAPDTTGNKPATTQTGKANPSGSEGQTGKPPAGPTDPKPTDAPNGQAK